MKIIGITMLVLFLIMFLFGTVKVNGKPTDNIFTKAIGAAVFAVIIGLIVGIPILGIIKLIT